MPFLDSSLYIESRATHRGMTTVASPPHFTPLESLLLCQSVAQYGVANAPFEKISEDLRHSVIVKSAVEYDNGRLDADALKALFLQLLKAEAKEHLRNALRDDAAQNGNGSIKITEEPNSPQLSKIEDADEHAQLIPQLVDKLYLSYKDHAFREIQAEEQRYDKLMASMRKSEVNEAELRKVDIDMNEVQGATGHEAVVREDGALDIEAREVLARQQDAQQKAGGLLNPSEDINSTELTQGSARVYQPDGLQSGRKSPEKSSHLSPPKLGHPAVHQSSQQQDATVTRPVSEPRAPELKIDSLLNPEPRVLPPMDMSRSPSRGAPNGMAPGPASPGAQTTYPLGAASQYPASYAQADSQQVSYTQPVRPHIGGSPTFFNGQSVFNPPILPPIPAMAPQHQSSSHWSPVGSPVYNRSAAMSAQPRRLPSPEQMRRPSLPLQPVTTPALQQSRSSFQAPAGAQYGSRQTPTYQPPNHRGGVMLPPFQVQVPQMPQNMAYQQMPRSNATPTMGRNLPHSQQFAMSEPRPWPQHLVENTFAPRGGSARTTPIRPGQFAAQNGTAFYSPGSNTGWKAGAALRRSQTVIRKPSLSPEREHPPPSAKGQTPGSIQKSTGKSAKSSTTKKQGTTTKQTQSKGVPAKRGRPARDTSNTPAVISPKDDARTRSHSTTSHQDEPSFMSVASNDRDDNDPATPAFIIEDTSEISETPTRAVSGRGRGRGRGRGGLSTVAMTAAATKKRKREQSSMLSDLTTKPSPSPAPLDQSLFAPLDSDEPLTILASRNFQRMTAPIMNNITSHKHASIFANPVRLKDAEGYTDIIRRPQDLKSIRAAIVAGSRAVAAATAGMTLGTDSPAAGVGTPTGASTPSGSSTGANASGLVRLPWSPALVPPLGIVNGAQLEQELCRMFGNAVMFNPGNGGVVHDTREMFESVESAVAAWRATEKEVGELSMVEKSIKGKVRRSVEGESESKLDREADEDGAKDGDESIDELSAPVAASGNKRRRTLV